jgi:hypothetical protein
VRDQQWTASAQSWSALAQSISKTHSVGIIGCVEPVAQLHTLSLQSLQTIDHICQIHKVSRNRTQAIYKTIVNSSQKVETLRNTMMIVAQSL